MMTIDLTWHCTKPDRDIREMVEVMKPMVRAELRLLTGRMEWDVLAESVEASKDVFTIRELRSREIKAIIGVKPFSLVGGGASPWMVTALGSEKYRRHLLVWSKRWLDEWFASYLYLENYVLAEFKEAVNWARHVGFTVHDPYPYGSSGELFHMITMGE